MKVRIGTMKVVLFKINWWNPKQAAIGLFTWSKVSHSALLPDSIKKLFDKAFKDYLLDASESRGNVNWHSKRDGSLKSLQEFGGQKIIVYQIPEDENISNPKRLPPIDYALSKIGYKYNWKGIMGWLPFLKTNDASTVYCFEYVLQTLMQFETINNRTIDELDFDFEIRKKLYRKPIDSDDIFVLLESAGLAPIYQGRADKYDESIV